MNKNQKISASLKRHYSQKRRNNLIKRVCYLKPSEFTSLLILMLISLMIILGAYAQAVEASQWELSDVKVPVKIETVWDGIIEVSAYNVGDKFQTDDSPCIGATGENLCEVIKNEIIFANNTYPKGTRVCIEHIGCGRIADRMNSRYKNRFDLAMRLDEKQRAIKFGVQNLRYKIIK